MRSDSYNKLWNGVTVSLKHRHFHQRLLERYGILLGPGEYQRIRHDILDGSAVAVERTPAKNKAIYGVRIESARAFVLVMADRHGRPYTAYPPRKSLLHRYVQRILNNPPPSQMRAA